MWDLTLDQFLDTIWRKKASHLGNIVGLASIASHLDETALMQLATGELVESRLVTHTSEGYQLEFGPFNLDQIEKHQMLMIQSLESHLPMVSDMLKEHFSFIPRWRIDDVMATYAHESASCGAHFDHYDVFLLQIRGSKTWHLDNGGHSDSELSVEADIRLLQEFQPTKEVTQELGDLLYVPPGTGHWGIASNDSLTLSIGIRNPTMLEMLSHLADSVGDLLPSAETLDDNLLHPDKHSGIPSSLTLIEKLRETLTNPSLTEAWYGQYMTELREPELIQEPDSSFCHEDITILLAKPQRLHCHLATRLAHQLVSSDSCLIFVNGESYEFEAQVLEWFSPFESNRYINTSNIQINDSNIRLVTNLLESGAIF